MLRVFAEFVVSVNVSVLAGGAVPNCCVTQIWTVAGVVAVIGSREYHPAGALVVNVTAPPEEVTLTGTQLPPPDGGRLTVVGFTWRVCASTGAANSTSTTESNSAFLK